MGKRKASLPKRVDESKRQTLTWNMKDLRHDIEILADEDPELLAEQERANKNLENFQDNITLLEQDSDDNECSSYKTTSFESDEKLQNLINDSEFYISVYEELPVKPGIWSCKLGRFSLKIRQTNSTGLPKFLPIVPEFWIYVMTDDQQSYLVYFEVKRSDPEGTDAVVYFKATSEMPYACFKSLHWKSCQVKNFCLVNDGYDETLGEICVSLYALEGALMKLQFPSEGTRPKQSRITAIELMAYFYSFTLPDLTEYPYTKKHDICAIYEEVKNRHTKSLPLLKVSVQHPNLKPRLRDYQKKAVIWMLTRECFQSSELSHTSVEEKIHPLYEEFRTLDQQTLYYNKYAGYLVKEKPLWHTSSSGGILADEMGLGKTVEVLSCILTHPRTGLPEAELLPVIEDMESEYSELTDKSNNPFMLSQMPDPDYSMDIVNANTGISVKADSVLNLDGTVDIDSGLEAGTSSNTNDENPAYIQTELCSIWIGKQLEIESTNNKLEYSVEVAGTSANQSSSWQNGNEEMVVIEGGLNSASFADSHHNMVASAKSRIDDHNYCLAPNEWMVSSLNIDTDGDISTIVCSGHSYDDDGRRPDGSPDHCYSDSRRPDGSPGHRYSDSRSPDGSPDHCYSDSRRPDGSPDHCYSDSRRPDGSPDHCYSDSRSPDGLQSNPTGVPVSSNELLINSTETDIPRGGTEVLASTSSDTYSTDIAELSTPNQATQQQEGNIIQSSVESSKGSNLHMKITNRKKAVRTRKISTSSAASGKSKSQKKSRRKKLNKNKEDPIQGDVMTKDVPREPDLNFECICGEQKIGDNDLGVECQMCGLYQHAKCVNYELKDPYRGIYLCPHCHVIAPPIPSGATLIIAPRSISHQWVEEIQKHIQKESLKVLVYSGVHKVGYIQPQTLARQDIVILSYETLRKEIDYVDLPHSKSDSGRRFRNPKRFMAIPSPITAVEWWRICLDEAQMVESVTTKTAEMALRLKAINRWCVTGTPIQRSIEDLYGLFVFLGVEPYWVHFWWTELLYKPFCHGQKEALFTVLTETLWRTAKKDVLDQICLPTLTEEVHWLKFSPVEEHFYRRQFRECANEAMQKLGRWTDSETKLNSLDRTTLHQLLHPLVHLRQACCHPQAVKGEFLPIRKSTLTMEELLNQLVKKVRIECEESHRQLVFALNGLAALDIIQNNYAEAVDKYRTVLRSVEEHKSEIRTDELQQLHTLHNLHEILLTKPAGVPPTLRDSVLEEQAKEIKKKYIVRFQQQVTQAREAWSPVQKSLAEVTQQLRKGQDWWIGLLNWATCVNLDVQLVEKVKEDLADNRQPDIQSMALRFRNIRGLQYIMVTHLDDLQTIHQGLIKLLKKLSREPSMDLINQTVECCLRPADKILKTCPFCEADELFTSYESKLFSFIDKGVTEQVSEDDAHFSIATRRQGTWADSECELTLKSILAFGKTWGGDSRFLDCGTTHIKMLDAQKKEFKCLRTLWLYLRERVSAMDELDMATTRMRLRLPDEVKSDIPQSNVLEIEELQPQKMKLKSDQVIYKNELRRKLGQLLYLKNLAMAQTDFEGGQNPSPCPVCQRKLGTKWSVLQCGHCYCLECVRVLIEQYSLGTHRRNLKCPICRQRTSHADISYVSTKCKNESQNNDVIKVKGDHSTKVEGIVHCLLTIHKKEPRAKTLVFSTWTDVLDVLSTALFENNISFKTLHASNKFQKNLNSFKHNPDVQVLLLPIQSGSNGLNLIEATHVILVEPILNVAQELQAIGRIHRIGQTKPTAVHRFLVRGTIEERMHYLLQNLQMSTNSNNTEETTLTIGELSSLFKDHLPEHDLDEEDDDDEETITVNRDRPSQGSQSVG